MYCQSNNWWRFHKILWRFQNTYMNFKSKCIIECLYFMIWPLFRFLGRNPSNFCLGILENLKHQKVIPDYWENKENWNILFDIELRNQLIFTHRYDERRWLLMLITLYSIFFHLISYLNLTYFVYDSSNFVNRMEFVVQI